MNTQKLFSTKERLTILENVIFAEGEIGVSEVAKKIQLSKGLVSKYFDILLSEGILRRNNTKFAVTGTKDTRSLKIMLNIAAIDTRIFRRYKFVESAGIYGSCAKGTNTESSDTDMWVKIDKTGNEKIARFTADLRRAVKNVKVLVLDDRKLEALKRNDALFYHSLYFGSVIIYGKEDAI